MKTLVILDAGHGPETPGKRTPDGTLREYNFNHPTTQLVGKKLASYADVSVQYVYDTTAKVDTPLKARTDKANAIYAQNKDKQVIYVSIHANASGDAWSNAKGIETFVYTTKPKTSVTLADDVQKAVVKATGRQDRGVKSDNLHVLRETHMPAILVECGFMTNKEEAELLKSSAYREKVAIGITNGIVAHCGLKKK